MTVVIFDFKNVITSISCIEKVYARDASNNIFEIKYNNRHVGNNSWEGWTFKAAETIDNVNSVVIQKSSNKNIEVLICDEKWNLKSYTSYANNSTNYYATETSFNIDFNGDGVIGNTINESLPDGFQKSEYLLDHGMVDMVVHRKDLKSTISKIIDILLNEKD